MVRNHHALRTEAAEEVGARALAFLAAEPARLSRFLALTGLDLDDVRGQIDAPELLSAVLDHLAHDEPLLLAFAAGALLAPESVGQALSVLQEANRERQGS